MKISKNFYVGFKQIDDKLLLKSSEMLNFFIDVAGVHSHSVGDGYTSSNEKWILTGYNVKVLKKPEYTTDITLKTWSRNYTPLIASREFELYDKQGQLIITALADFVRYDVKEKRLKKITQDLMQKYQSMPSLSNFKGEKLNKVTEEENYDGFIEEFIDWKWLDLNGHMNNSHYLELAEHVINKIYDVSVAEYSFDVLYKKEIYENSPIKAYYKKLSQKEYKVIIKSADDKVLHTGIRFYK